MGGTGLPAAVAGGKKNKWCVLELIKHSTTCFKVQIVELKAEFASLVSPAGYKVWTHQPALF